MSVRIQPNHTTIGVPQWRHVPAHRALGQQVPDMGTLTLSADGEYDITIPDSVWLTVMEDLQEHFARKDAAAEPAKVHTFEDTLAEVRAVSVARAAEEATEWLMEKYGSTWAMTAPNPPESFQRNVAEDFDVAFLDPRFRVQIAAIAYYRFAEGVRAR
jgi:hypothetical protein